ncbi:MAG: hypothetical protein J6B91_09255 [Prevotella sp.]|nr:hypothetical protein [Prevotella sp.]
MTHLEFTCSDEKATALLRAARCFDEGTELEPVKCGDWIVHIEHVRNIEETDEQMHLECSVCGRKVFECSPLDDMRICIKKYPYCHCGVKMHGFRFAEEKDP